jgi:hypothetical protein
MIASLIVKRMVRAGVHKAYEDDVDVDAVVKQWADDASYDVSSELGVGETIKGKKAIAEWLKKWEKEFPKRKIDVKSICFSAWPLMPRNVMTVQFTITDTDTQGREYTWDGVSVFHTKNFKAVRATEHISMLGLPQLSNLIKPKTKA